MASNTDNTQRSLWLLIIIVLFLSVATMANLYLLLQDRNASTDDEAGSEVVAADLPPPMFVTIGPMTVNLINDSFGQRLLYIGLSLRVLDEDTRNLLDTHMPEIKSRLLVLLSSQSADTLTTPEGKEALSAEILALLAEPLQENQTPPAIHSVLYTDFIVQ